MCDCDCSAVAVGRRRDLWGSGREGMFPTVVGDFTGHQVELLQTPALLGDDFHAPTTREGEKNS